MPFDRINVYVTMSQISFLDFDNIRLSLKMQVQIEFWVIENSWGTLCNKRITKKRQFMENDR